MRWGACTGLLSLLALPACNESFECASDSHCELDGVAGFCESIGHCSFPDEACETGRRFGNLAGSLSNQCVPPPDGASSGPEVTSTSVASTGSTGADPSADPSMTSSPGSTSAATSETTAGDSSGGEVQPCSVLFEDSFEGDMLDPIWTTLGNPRVEAGAVRFEIDPAAAGTYQKAIALNAAGIDLTNGSVTLNIESIPQVSRTQGTLSLEQGGSPIAVMVLYEGGGSRPLLFGDGVEHSMMTLPWVRVAFSSGSGGLVLTTVSESEDGQEWVEVSSFEAEMDVTEIEVELTAGSYGDFGIAQEFAVSSIEICGSLGGL